MNKDGTGTIIKIHKRKNYLSRKAPKLRGASYRGERLEQIIAANIDDFYIITSADEPTFNHKSLDRFLVSGESSSLHPIIVINKIDLMTDDFSNEWKNFYEKIGYKVFITSVTNNRGIEELKLSLNGKKNLFWGHSGVGKSSLLNSMFSHLNIYTQKISEQSAKGKHTTVTVTMYPIDETTFIIDTPGIREIDPYGVKKEDLSHYFIEFLPYIQECFYNRCIHEHEPGCAVLDAVEENKISLERYDSYLRILDTIEDDLKF